jgi:hypothetical protein
MRKTIGLAIAFVTLSSIGAWAVSYQPKPEAKSIKEVMKIAHKDGLLKKITEGNASDSEKKELLDLYIDMLEGTPPKGETNDWHLKAGLATISAAKVVLGREGAIEELKSSTNCKSCHDQFK